MKLQAKSIEQKIQESKKVNKFVPFKQIVKQIETKHRIQHYSDEKSQKNSLEHTTQQSNPAIMIRIHETQDEQRQDEDNNDSEQNEGNENSKKSGQAKHYKINQFKKNLFQMKHQRSGSGLRINKYRSSRVSTANLDVEEYLSDSPQLPQPIFISKVQTQQTNPSHIQSKFDIKSLPKLSQTNSRNSTKRLMFMNTDTFSGKSSKRDYLITPSNINDDHPNQHNLFEGNLPSNTQTQFSTNDEYQQNSHRKLKDYTLTKSNAFQSSRTFMDKRLSATHEKAPQISSLTSNLNTQVMKMMSQIKQIEDENDPTRVPIYEYYTQKEKKIKEKSHKQIAIITARLSNILQNQDTKIQTKLKQRVFAQIKVQKFCMQYFILQVHKMQPPLYLYIRKPSQEMRLTFFFCKYYDKPNIDENEFKFDDIDQPLIYRVKLNDERGVSSYGAEQFYLGLLSNQEGEIEMAYSFSQLNPILLKSKYMLSDKKIFGSRKRNMKYQEIKDEIEEVLNDDIRYAEYIEDLDMIYTEKAENLKKQQMKRRMQTYRSESPLRHEYESISQFRTYTQFKQDKVLEMKEAIQEEDRKKKIFLLHKQFFIQEYRQQRVKEATILCKKRQFAKAWLNFFFIQQMFKKTQQNFIETKKMIAKEKYRDYLAKKIQTWYRCYVKLRKKSLKKIHYNYIRFSLNFTALMYNGKDEEIAKQRFKNFFLSMLKQNQQTRRFRQFYNGIVKIQQRFRQHMMMVNLRKKILIRIWDKGRQELLDKILQNPKTKKNLKLVKRLENLENQVRDYVLNVYLSKCQVQYNAFFFKWHGLMSQQTKSDKKKLQFIKILNKLNDKENELTDLNSEEQALFDLGVSSNNPQAQQSSDQQDQSFQLRQDRIENFDAINFEIHNMVDTPTEKDTKKKKEPGFLITEVDLDKMVQYQNTGPVSTQNSNTSLKVGANLQMPMKRMQTVKRSSTPKMLKISKNNSSELKIVIKNSNTTISYHLYDQQMNDLANPPKLIYLPTRDLIQRMILRSCFLKRSILCEIIPTLEKRNSLYGPNSQLSSPQIKSQFFKQRKTTKERE